MRYIESKSTDVCYNLALEEYIFEHCRESEWLLLWKNDTSVVLGKYQNIYQEINLKEVESRQIKAVRRNTGGGTVFHDEGNLNYSLVTDYDPEKFSNYDGFLEPVIRALNSLGVPAEKRNSSDIVVEGKKISGSAQTIKKGRILHHGTLLFDADLEDMRLLLKRTSGVIESKAVKSVRSQVINVKDYIGDPAMTIKDLADYLFANMFPGIQMEEYCLSKEADETIRQTAEEKYGSWEWNYGRSPAFTFKKDERIAERPIGVELRVAKGRIAECHIAYDGFDKVSLLEEKLIDSRYCYEEVKALVQSVVGTQQAEAVTDCFF